MTNTQQKERLSPYQSIEVSLRDRVRKGYWASGQSLPGRRKLAQEYGVALSTVQRAIAGLIEDGTLETDGTLGTFVSTGNRSVTAAPAATPNEAIAGISKSGAIQESSKTNDIRIGILIDNYAPPESGEQTENTFFGPLFDGIRSSLARENVYVSYVFRDGRSVGELGRASGCDGLIVMAAAIQELFELRSLYAANIPFVALLTSFDTILSDKDLPCVDADNRAGAQQAVRHLVELGHKQIAIVNLAVCQTNLGDRFSGYLSALCESALTIDSRHLLVSAQPWNEPVFEAQIEKWFSGLVEANCVPSAIFCADFTMTLQTMSAIQQHGLRIPEDISVVGFDDPPYADLMSPPMTLVRQPVFQMGRRAATRLLEHLQTSSGRLSGTERLPTQLIVRQSTSAPRSVNG